MANKQESFLGPAVNTRIQNGRHHRANALSQIRAAEAEENQPAVNSASTDKPDVLSKTGSGATYSRLLGEQRPVVRTAEPIPASASHLAARAFGQVETFQPAGNPGNLGRDIILGLDPNDDNSGKPPDVSDVEVKDGHLHITVKSEQPGTLLLTNNALPFDRGNAVFTDVEIPFTADNVAGGTRVSIPIADLQEVGLGTGSKARVATVSSRSLRSIYSTATEICI